MFIFASLELRKVKISIVNYTNTLPFKWAIKRSRLLDQIDLQEDIPSICAQKLKYKQVDLALVPVALISQLEKYHIETNFCIGADGKVDSVKLYSQVPLSEVKTVTLDYQSLSSITLTKVLFKFFWKQHVKFEEAKPGFEKTISGSNAAVVIGDRTFAMNGQFNYEFDLAEQWKRFTGLPFVFAAWVSTEKLDPHFIEQFNDVLRSGVNDIKGALAQDYQNNFYSKEQTLKYLTQRINYNLDTDKLKALDLFLDYITKL